MSFASVSSIRVARPILVVAVCSAAAAMALRPAPTVSAPAAAAQSFKVDPVHSSAWFKIGHMNISHTTGRFNKVNGSFTIDESNPSACKFNLEADTNSVDTNAAPRDQHLRKPDFFNSKQYPKISFASRSIKAGSNGALSVTGDLMLHGKTKSITVEFQKVGMGKGMQGEMRAGYDATFKINRSDFDMKYMLQAVSDEIEVSLCLEGGKQ